MRLRSIARGILAGSTAAVLLLLQPDPKVGLVLILSLTVGAFVAAGTYRRGLGMASLPDGVLILLFLGATGFWSWNLVTGHHGMVVSGWSDAAAAAIVMGFPVAGIALVVWNRVTTGRNLLDEAGGEPHLDSKGDPAAADG